MDKLTPFDKLISSSELQMMKLFIPYTEPRSRQMLAVYIKFMELQNTLRYFSTYATNLHSQDLHHKNVTPIQIFEEISPYLPNNISEQFEQMKTMMDMMEMMQGQNVSDMFQMFSGDITSQEGDDTDERMDEQSQI